MSRFAGAGQRLRIVIDDDLLIEGSIKHCNVSSCVAEFAIDADKLIERLSTGRAISILGVDSSGRPRIADIPLAGFTEAYAAPGKRDPHL